MAATKPYFSEPVRVSTDELMTELLRRAPEDALNEALQSACTNAQHRLSKNRHQRYQCQRFFRKLALRLTNPSSNLATVVGLKDVHPQSVRPPTRSEVKTPPREVVTTADQPLSKDQLEDLSAYLDLPTFADFKSVFESYPYIKIMKRAGYGRLLVLGYASGFYQTRQAVLRRNSTLDEVVVQHIPTIFKDLHSESGGVRQGIKVVPYQPGRLIRSWTNIQGTGDLKGLNRYNICHEWGIDEIDQHTYNKALDLMRQTKTE